MAHWGAVAPKTNKETKVRSNEKILDSMKHTEVYVICDFCRKVAENCALVGYYAASGGNFLDSS